MSHQINQNDKIINNLYKSYNEEIGLNECFLEPLKSVKRNDDVMMMFDYYLTKLSNQQVNLSV